MMTNEDLSKLTVPALRRLAAERNVKGRSTMTKPALIEALTVDDVPSGVDPSAMGRIAILPDVTVTLSIVKPIDSVSVFTDATDEVYEMIRDVSAFQARAMARYIKSGRKFLTPKQRRRVAHKTNAYMQKAGW